MLLVRWRHEASLDTRWNRNSPVSLKSVSERERGLERYTRQAASEPRAGEDGAEAHDVSGLPTRQMLLGTWVPVGIHENSPHGSESQTSEVFLSWYCPKHVNKEVSNNFFKYIQDRELSISQGGTMFETLIFKVMPRPGYFFVTYISA